MAPDLAAACPRCSAHLRPGAPWCTQCFVDLRPAQGSAPSPPPVHDDDHPDDGEPPPGWPCTACGARSPMADATCRGCGLPFLGALPDAGPPVFLLPVVGDLTRLSGAQRIGVAMLLVLLVMAVTAALGVAFG